MTQLTADYLDPTQYAQAEQVEACRPADANEDVLHRPWWIALPFAMSLLLSGVSWMAQGLPMATDVAFIVMALWCLVLLTYEILFFSRRFGLGGCVFFGGVLLWFCYDYFSNWFQHDFNIPGTIADPTTVAKAAYYHSLFIMVGTLGLRMKRGRWLSRIIGGVPQPRSEIFFILPIIGLTLIGLLPYMLFTSVDFFSAIGRMMVAGRSEMASIWTVGRTGNLNYNWGGYIAQMLQMGQIGAQLGVFYALLVARSWMKKGVVWLNWLFWLALAFGSGTRGEVVFMALPVVLLLFVKYHAIAASKLRLISIRAYLVSAVILTATFTLVQIQGLFRNTGFADIDLSAAKEDIVQLRGNTMFSEALDAYAVFPENRPFFYDEIPGEAIVRPVPQALFWFVLGPIPRALWNDKPIDPAWAWRAGGKGASDDLQGTTLSTGLVGYWYFRYGWPGVIEGALLFGWLIACGERAFRRAGMQAMPTMFALAYMTWLFRCFRDFTYNEIYPVMIGGLLLTLAIKLESLLFSQRTE